MRMYRNSGITPLGCGSFWSTHWEWTWILATMGWYGWLYHSSRHRNCGNLPWNLGVKNMLNIYMVGTSNIDSWNGHGSSLYSEKHGYQWKSRISMLQGQDHHLWHRLRHLSTGLLHAPNTALAFFHSECFVPLSFRASISSWSRPKVIVFFGVMLNRSATMLGAYTNQYAPCIEYWHIFTNIIP